ncbi:MAG: hypothetical protein CMF31_00140 [Kordiimonas sp.]|nr:hypothetical protein [Kordiimonas sp.]|tara:strand:- start:338 stop:673 length:336 start_codon:yes stop_codon:yes gene_type:complete
MSDYKIVINYIEGGVTGHWNVTFKDATGAIIEQHFPDREGAASNEVTIGQNLDNYYVRVGRFPDSAVPVELSGGLFIEDIKIDESYAGFDTLYKSEEISVTAAQGNAGDSI